MKNSVKLLPAFSGRYYVKASFVMRTPFEKKNGRPITNKVNVKTEPTDYHRALAVFNAYCDMLREQSKAHVDFEGVISYDIELTKERV